MPRRRRKAGVVDLDDADLLERVLARDDLDAYETHAFEGMAETVAWRVAEYGADARGLSEAQREWAERVAARESVRMSGVRFAEFVRSVIGRDLRL